MKIVVTGGAGKLGRWVVAELAAHGHAVTVFDQTRAAVPEAARVLSGDICDLGHTIGAVAGADAVIHLAGIFTHSIAPNEVTFRVNVMGTFNVHEAAWRQGVDRVVTMSSEAVLGWAPGAYERPFVPDYLPIDEAHPQAPQDCYGLSKVAAEAIARSYTAKCGMTTIAFRPPWFVSPEELAMLSRQGGRKPDRFGLYNYIDVRDLSEALRLAVERPLTGHHAFFIGAGESVVAEPMASLLPRLMPEIGDKAAGLTGARSTVSIERAKATLGWAPTRSWRTAA